MLISSTSRHLLVCGSYSSIELQKYIGDINQDNNHDNKNSRFWYLS